MEEKANRVLTTKEKWAGYKPGQCRWCKEDVKRFSPSRRTFCCDECVREYKIRSDVGFARGEVYKRDKGICQICGLDCSKFFSGLKRHLKGISYRDKEAEAEKYFLDHGVPYVKWKHRSTFYDADHIKPVVQNGGSCGLDNLRLLCIPCHLGETKKLRKELSKGKSKDEPASC